MKTLIVGSIRNLSNDREHVIVNNFYNKRSK